MIRCIVIDDERIAREGLLEFIKAFDFLECVGDYANPFQAMDLIKNKEVDLIFLDIEMPRIKGIQFAELVNNDTTMIIFTTAYSEYALKGYKVNAIEYLLKPVFLEDFTKAVHKAKRLYELMYPQDSQFIFFREDGVDHRVHIDEITYVKSLQNYVQVYFRDNRHMIVHKTLKSLQETLPAEKFIQIHRSYLVQSKYIASINGLTAMVNNTSLPIARERKQLLLSLLTNR
ncbi:LytTR family DNA-binding domain-containing protein [Xanthocytophaga agilis]|uniref:LytTR family DNA-binding domain-containing protein n=1 Tax=Xanthocytophaga agilis TaxID=3048010 RepID=A0AAE3R111_9BACT|nr:LytTR family DNA-binding domain-containing protein [Xanthocytophaga agilis]MDJ1499465.1 LytTR family DNA-binding domain-containing protein [Xanthocytophaga agilis]